jgi:HD superfamily phosphohydrolase
MRWHDRVYGPSVITEPDILAILATPTFQRLKGVRQAGPSALAFPFKNVTRYEHSLGVFVLLRRLGARTVEQVAGLLHDISHTAFSHAVDFVIASEEQDHHESLKPLMLSRPDVVEALGKMGLTPGQFHDDSIYPLLEQPLPLLCADRLDYFLRDGMACGVVDHELVAGVLGSMTVENARIVLSSVRVAEQVARAFAIMNRDWWASRDEAYIYNEFADALREAMRLGVIVLEDLMTDDESVLAKLDAAGNPLIASKLAAIRGYHPKLSANYAPRVIPKERWLDPALILAENAR